MAGKRGKRQHHDFDLVLAGEFRARGEIVETLASHLEILAELDIEIGLLWLRDPAMPAAAPVHGRVARLVRGQAATPIEPDAEPLSCRLLVLYEPRLAAGGLAATPRVRADGVLVVVAQPPARRDDLLFDVTAAAERIAERIARRQVWCPATPQIRAQLRQHAAGLTLAPEDLRPCEPLAAWRTGRAEPGGRKPVLGRILRYDDDRLPADKATLLAAYPPDVDLEVRFLGGDKAVRELVKPLPASWRLFEPDSVSARRFLARLDFHVQYQDDPGRLFPRATLQAMAAGRLAVLPSGFRAVLGDGPVYRPPEQVADTVRYLHAEPRFYARYLAEQDAALAEPSRPGSS
jgi:hypothetical protein